jgi:hypothetical protein
MEFFRQGESIECDSAEIISRDIKVGSYIDVPNIGKCTKINCKRNSEAKILQELNPKKAIRNPASKLNLGDTIKGENLTVYTKGSLHGYQVINKSGRHKAQQAYTKGYTYAEISLQFRSIPLLNAPRQIA